MQVVHRWRQPAPTHATPKLKKHMSHAMTFDYVLVDREEKTNLCHTACVHLKQSSASSSFSCIWLVFVTLKEGNVEKRIQYNILSCSKASFVWICVHWRWNKSTSAPVSDVLNSLSLTRNSRKQWLRSSQLLSWGYSLVVKAFIHWLWRCWPSYGPCEHPFQTEGERDHPSAGLLRIFMTG